MVYVTMARLDLYVDDVRTAVMKTAGSNYQASGEYSLGVVRAGTARLHPRELVDFRSSCHRGRVF